MMILSNNFFLALGWMAISAMVVFRGILRNTLDAACAAPLIAIGPVCGASEFTSGVVGCLATAAILLYFRLTSFSGTRHHQDRPGRASPG